MNILVIGSGGREHTLAWKIHQSKHCENLYVAPGNAGTAAIATNVAVSASDFNAIADIIGEKNISLVVVGPEDPLVNGLRDFLMERSDLADDLLIVGPGKTGAMLEGSKDFSKKFLDKYNIPTARSKTFSPFEIEEALAYISTKTPPVVLKADGLAAGKGVIIAPGHEQAKEAMKEMLLGKKFGDASSKVLIEDYLEGIEVSIFVLTDGKSYILLPEAKDYKRIGDGDIGPNTGGMGAVTPVPFADVVFLEKVENRIIKPTIEGLQKENIPYIGFIFIGLMSVNGEPYVIEYNVRMGDPESQAVLPRIKTDFVELLVATANGTLSTINVEFDTEAAVTVVLASEGYPNSYDKGHPITGLDNTIEGLVFHAGTVNKEGAIQTNGGRVLAVTGRGPDVAAAQEKAYLSLENITWKGMQYRKDIGNDILSMT